jgi:nitronate monooxygenase
MMAKAWNQTRVSELLGIEYPIIQGPLGGLSSQRLTSAVSNFGGLGSFGAHGLEPNAIEDVIAEIRSLTAKPFAMNLWVSMEDAEAHTLDAATFRRALSHLSPHIEALGSTQPEFAPYKPIRFEDQARVLLDTNVPAFSFIYGIPPKEILDEARKRGIVTVGTATTPDEAIALEQAGVEVVVASGFEAGGHRGSFLRSAQDSLTGTFSLVPQTVDAVKIPVRRSRHRRSLRARSGRRTDGHGLSRLRGVRRAPPASPGYSRRPCRTDRTDSRLYRQTRTRHRQRTTSNAE